MKQTHRYSYLILPIIYLMDAILIFLFVYLSIHHNLTLNTFWYLVFWFVTSFFTKYYEVYRNTRPAEIISKSIKQLLVMDLSVIAYFHFFAIQLSNRNLIKYLLLLNIFMLLVKLLIYVLFKIYRSKGGNNRNYIIVGYNDETIKFKKILDTRVDYGYIFNDFFGKKNIPEVYGDFSNIKDYVLNNYVDVIFCSLKECSDDQIKEIINFADDRFINVKFIPDNKEILGKNLNIDYFDYFPVLSMNKSPLDKPINKIIKRSFDIIFSFLVMVCVLSWLVPLLSIAIKIESKGSIFFTQLRNGINYKPFYCYKFRSMRPNKFADSKQVSKGDNRITKIGKILRKSSVDELPQFINVFKGEMSVVGPRPHMIKENERFLKRVDKFMGRHYVKPGITGLAQVKGYRGEIKTDEDIHNRLKYDLHYIENWSFWLDLKIILFTILNVIKGDDKAY